MRFLLLILLPTLLLSIGCSENPALPDQSSDDPPTLDSGYSVAGWFIMKSPPTGNSSLFKVYVTQFKDQIPELTVMTFQNELQSTELSMEDWDSVWDVVNTAIESRLGIKDGCESNLDLLEVVHRFSGDHGEGADISGCEGSEVEAVRQFMGSMVERHFPGVWPFD